jgi:hypothetical protein
MAGSHITFTGEENVCTISNGNHDRRRPVLRLRKDNIKTDLKYVGYENVL